MGKRELLIISAFVVAGVLVFQFTVPASPARPSRFTLSSFVDSFRRNVRGNSATATVTTRGVIDVDPAITETRISAVSRLTVTGAARADIGYELTVESNGPDQVAAREAAARTTVAEDRVGSVLALRAAGPKGVRQVIGLVLLVPNRFAIRVEGGSSSGKVDATDVASMQLDSVVGDVQLTRVAGAVTGTHRNGDLGISGAGTVNLTTTSSKVSLDEVRSAVTMVARNGRGHIAGLRGHLDLDVTNQETTIDEPSGTVRVVGTGGKITVNGPKGAVTIDMRRTGVDVTLTQSVPLTVLTTDAALRLQFALALPIVLDAVATDGGRIRADDFFLTPQTTEQETRLHHTFGAGTTAVALRNQRSEIVISSVK